MECRECAASCAVGGYAEEEQPEELLLEVLCVSGSGPASRPAWLLMTPLMRPACFGSFERNVSVSFPMESRLAPGMTAKCTPSQLPASGIEYAEHFPLARCVGSLKLRAAEAKRSERRLFKRWEGEVHARCSLRRVGIRLLSRCGRCAFCGGAPSVLDKSCYPTQATLDYVRERMPYLTRPVHCLVPKWERCSLDDVHLHGSSYPYRSGSFLRIDHGVIVPCPELCFLQLAQSLDLLPLIQAGCFLCATFGLDPSVPSGLMGRAPVDKPSTHRRLSRALPRSRWPYTRAGGSAVCLR